MGKTKGGSSKQGGAPRVNHEKSKLKSKEIVTHDRGEDVVEYEPLIKKRGPRKPKPPNEVYIAAFEKCEYVPTRWGDKKTLRELGLLEDVHLVLKNMGFDKVLDMAHKTYPREVSQLLGTFEIKYQNFESIEKLGFVRFFVDNFGYKLSIQDLCKAYGFPQILHERKRVDKRREMLAWKLIGKGTYEPGTTKATNIGNPAVRYAHKLLAHTMFGRYQTDKVKLDEMSLLTNGIKPLLEEECEKRKIRGYENLNLGILLANRILNLKRRIFEPSKEGGKIYIGGFLTPLLLACKVPLGNPCPTPLLYLDMNHLLKMNFICGRDNNKIVYSFVNSKGEEAWVYLPNQDITRVDSLENISFQHGESATIKEAIDPAPIGRRMKGKDILEESSNQAIPLGSSRYYQPSFQGRINSEATRHALEGVKKIQRGHKWHSRALYNIKKGFKKEIKGLKDQISDFKETISGLKSIVETFVLRKGSPPRHEDGSTSYGMALEEARRHSISHLPSHQSIITNDPPRVSSFETREPRRRRRHFPTPSPPSSDNVSFHISDSYSEG